MKKKDRVVNLRFLFCVFAGIIFGIISCKLFLTEIINLFVFILSIILAVAIAVITVIYANRTEEWNSRFKSRKKVSFLLRWSSIGFAVSFVIGILVCIYPTLKTINVKDYSSAVIVNGVVCDYVDVEATYKKFIIDDCVVANDFDVEEIDYKIVIYTSTFSDVELGDNITFEANLNKFDYKDDFDFSQLSQGIAYSTYIDSSDYVITENTPNFRDVVHLEVRELLHENLSEDNAEICYAVIFGQKHGLDENISSMFSYAGISHILAVSGLHIGVLVSAIWFLLNKIKVNKYVKISIFGVILLFYSYLCNFSPSVCRASLMAFTLACCNIFMIEYDILSSLSLSGIIILLFSPLSLFSVSFQLSYMCIFAIITFAPSLEKLLKKIKIPKVLASALAVSFAVNIVILPVCMNYFTKVSLLGVIANLFVLPIFSLTYILLFAIILIVLMISPLGGLLVLPNIFLHIIKVVAQHISSMEFGVFRVFNAGYLLLFFVSLATLTIHYFMLRHWAKVTWIGVLSCIIVVLFVINSMPTNYKSTSLIVSEQYNSNVAIYIEDDDIILIGSDISYDNLTFLMKDIKLNKIDKIIAYDLKLNNLNELKLISEEFGVEEILIPSLFDYDSIKDSMDNIYCFDDSVELNYLNLETITYNGDIIAVELILPQGNILIPCKENNAEENSHLIDYYLDAEYLLLDDNEIWQDVEYDGKIINFNDTETLVLG